MAVTKKRRWLSAKEQRAWRGLLTVSTLLMEALGRDLSRATDLSMADFEVLVHLSESGEGRMRMSSLAHKSLSSRSRLSHQVTRMEAQGWVYREDCDSDRRGSFAVITDAGRAALAVAAPVHVAHVRARVFDLLEPSEVAALASITAKIDRELEHLQGGAAPAEPQRGG